MAIGAACRPVRPNERESGFRVIEAGQVLPRLRRVARLASGDGPVRSNLLHAFLELSFMGIRMATRTVQILPVINHGRLGLERRFFVAIGTGHGDMPARQHETSLFVLGQSESGGPVSFEIMTAVAAVEVGRCGELTGMLVGVTIGAALELYLEQRILSLGNVALRAFQARMSALQRIGGGARVLSA